MKVLLVGNYEFDGSTSMQIWAKALLRELRQCGIDAQLISPAPVFGKLRPSPTGLGKWLGYIDRFLLFPRVLRKRAAEADIVHITDHGSAMFAFHVKGKPVLVTCNDMLAVRGALGEIPEMRSSQFGRLLQLWIRKGLEHATQIACISQFTLDDATRILKSGRNLCKVLNGLNYPYRTLDEAEVDRRLARLTEIRRPFILHVGSNHARKNRDGVLRVFAIAAESADLQMIFAGAALNDELHALARNLGLKDRVVQVVDPSVETLEALYNRAVSLLFPSRYEGFGWPPIEAQACGCPVVASGIPPLAEILGPTASLHHVEDESGMADSLVRLVTDGVFRSGMRQRGLENVRTRFQTARMIGEYLSLYRKLAPEH
jgi:glycosyltransferase involved in cell wall biosynthesis